MRAAIAIASRDLRATFASPLGYGLVAGYLALAGFLLVIALRAGEARLDDWFAPLFILTGLLCSLLTMRVFAEEEHSGSLELLLTAPVRPGQVVAGKLLGVLAVLGVVVAATLTAPIVVTVLGDPDLGPIVSGYAGLLLLGIAFSAMGLVASAATASQLVAAASSAGMLLGLWFGAAAVGSLSYLSPSTHIGGFLRGTITLVDVVYFVSFAVVSAATATVVLRARR